MAGVYMGCMCQWSVWRVLIYTVGVSNRTLISICIGLSLGIKYAFWGALALGFTSPSTSDRPLRWCPRPPR
jgi:hypothetical protein